MRDHTECCSLQKYDLITRGILVEGGHSSLSFSFFAIIIGLRRFKGEMLTMWKRFRGSRVVGIRENITLAWTAKGWLAAPEKSSARLSSLFTVSSIFNLC